MVTDKKENKSSDPLGLPFRTPYSMDQGRMADALELRDFSVLGIASRVRLTSITR